ncbi:hypothetical protein TNCV_2713241 [Trichonephila clavipes]|nr:hypothetical protein TNCV_2713241 [Trichonephila clavipes]
MYHLLTHDVQPIVLTKQTMNFNMRSVLCIQESRKEKTAGEGIRFLFWTTATTRYWHEAGPVQLAYD